MTQKEWKKRNGALRKILRDLRPVPTRYTTRAANYNFGAVFNKGAKIWHVYNYRTNNCVATVKFLGVEEGTSYTDKSMAVIRYRPKSWYAGVLKEFHYPFNTIHAPSKDLSKRSKWVRENVRPYIEQLIYEGKKVKKVKKQASKKSFDEYFKKYVESQYGTSLANTYSGSVRESLMTQIQEMQGLPGQAIEIPRMQDIVTQDYYTSTAQPSFRDRNGRLRDVRGRFVSEPLAERSTRPEPSDRYIFNGAAWERQLFED